MWSRLWFHKYVCDNIARVLRKMYRFNLYEFNGCPYVNDVSDSVLYRCRICNIEMLYCNPYGDRPIKKVWGGANNGIFT